MAKRKTGGRKFEVHIKNNLRRHLAGRPLRNRVRPRLGY